MASTDGAEKREEEIKRERWRYPRFFGENDGERAYVKGEDAKHMGAVLRMSCGDMAVVCDNNGRDFLCRIISVGKDLAELEIVEFRENEAEPAVEATLFQCLPKSDKMDFIVQKATELGVSKIVPVISKRCVSRPDPKSMDKKILRWKKIAEEAAKQCGRGKIPEIGEPRDFKAAVSEYSEIGTGILFYECGGVKLSSLSLTETKKIGVFIGSEGGFEEEEAEYARGKGLLTATLGKRILRCETAPVAALAILMNLTGNM